MFSDFCFFSCFCHHDLLFIFLYFSFLSWVFLWYNSSSPASFFSSFFLLSRLHLLSHFLPFFSSSFSSFGPFPSYCFFVFFFFDPSHLIAFSCSSSMNIKFFFTFLPIFLLPFFHLNSFFFLQESQKTQSWVHRCIGWKVPHQTYAHRH